MRVPGEIELCDLGVPYVLITTVASCCNGFLRCVSDMSLLGDAMLIAAAKVAIAGFPAIFVIDGAVGRGVAPSFHGPFPRLLCAACQKGQQNDWQDELTHYSSSSFVSGVNTKRSAG